MSAAHYWNRGINSVPWVTGAISVMDCSDLKDALDNLGVLVLDRVLDVGCGTGRLHRLCNNYLGVDIASDAVEYCRREGIRAEFITTPDTLPKSWFDTICCLSVFTHINRAQRQNYLFEFSGRAHEIIVDIIPGVEGGDIALYRADQNNFERDLENSGYEIVAVYNRTSPDNVTHRYYRAVQK